MEICCHHGGVSTCCRDGGDVYLQEFRRVRRTVILFRQVWPELGWPRRYAEMIRKRGTAHVGQRDTRQDPGTPWGLRCDRNEVLLEVATLEVLATLTCPL
jgi:hypothetical protein